MEQLNCQHGKAVKLLAELDADKGIGLIRRVKQGQGRPTKIYVMKAFFGQARLPNTGSQDFSKSEVQTSENRQSRLPQTGSADFPESARSYLEKNNPENSYTDPSIYPSKRTPDGIDVDGMREIVRENLEYDILMAYVPVPKDLTKVKTKVMFNLTKRQLICFGSGALIGVPLFFLLKNSTGVSTAAIVMVLSMRLRLFLRWKPTVRSASMRTTMLALKQLTNQRKRLSFPFVPVKTLIIPTSSNHIGKQQEPKSSLIKPT